LNKKNEQNFYMAAPMPARVNAVYTLPNGDTLLAPDVLELKHGRICPGCGKPIDGASPYCVETYKACLMKAKRKGYPQTPEALSLGTTGVIAGDYTIVQASYSGRKCFAPACSAWNYASESLAEKFCNHNCYVAYTRHIHGILREKECESGPFAEQVMTLRNNWETAVELFCRFGDKPYETCNGCREFHGTPEEVSGHKQKCERWQQLSNDMR
jgi:hypothetical protein